MCRPWANLCRASRSAPGRASARRKTRRLDIVDKLNKAINAALADPTIKERLAKLGGVPMPMSPAACESFIVATTKKWAKLIHENHIEQR